MKNIKNNIPTNIVKPKKIGFIFFGFNKLKITEKNIDKLKSKLLITKLTFLNFDDKPTFTLTDEKINIKKIYKIINNNYGIKSSCIIDLNPIYKNKLINNDGTKIKDVIIYSVILSNTLINSIEKCTTKDMFCFYTLKSLDTIDLDLFTSIKNYYEINPSQADTLKNSIIYFDTLGISLLSIIESACGLIRLNEECKIYI